MSKAPTFALKDKEGVTHKLSSFKSEFVVIYFYPKDNTPGCTLEAQDFSRLLPQFKKAKTEVVGISGGDEKSKTKFCEKHKLNVLLLSDPDFSVSKAYNAYGQKKFMGRSFQGIFRSTFVLNKKREIIKVFEQVKAAGHAEEVLKFIKSA
jgi:peroxiredoxin Q/BCP